jgi:hypothetical protein
LGERSTFIGQLGKKAWPLLRACCWKARICPTARSMASAMARCIAIGSLPSTKIGSQP